MDTVVLNFRLDGNGPNLLLLHPVGLDLTFFDRLVDLLEPHFRVLRVDLRGHGGSPAHQEGAVQLEDYADDVHLLLRQLSFAPASVTGFSLGGMVAQELALHYPGDVNALVVSACPCIFDAETRIALRERGAVAMRQGMSAVVESTLDRWFTGEFRERGADAAARNRLLTDDVESWGQAWDAISELDTESRLASIRVPTLCLAGERDVAAPPSVVETIFQRVPGAKFAVLPKAPHMLFIEYPDQTAAAITEFLGTASGRLEVDFR